MKPQKNDGDCVACGNADLQPAEIEVSGTVKGEVFKVRTSGLRCSNCGFQTIEGPVQMTEYRKLLADAFKTAHALVTGAALVAHRNEMGITQDEFANMEPKVGPASVRRWELGKIQDKRSNDILVEKMKPRTKKLQDYNVFVVCGSTSEQYALTSATHVGEFVTVGQQKVDIRRYMAALADWCPACRQTGIGEAFSESSATTVPPHLANLLMKGSHA